MARFTKWLLAILGVFLITIYVSALELGDLRKHTVEFEWLFFSAFILYGIACFIVLQSDAHAVDQRILLYGIFILTAVTQGILVFTRPILSDDMYRYVWDGRVQAQGISPYRYPPNAPELTYLRDSDIYPHINRKNVVTVYPPAAEAAYALLWRILPDSIHWFQAVMAFGGLLAGILLTGLLRDLGRSPTQVLVYLWSPLLAFETAHAAHVDGLVLPLLVGALWARVRERDGFTGFLLGVATAIKFYPALLLPFLWHPRHTRGWWQMPLAFVLALAIFYLPYYLASGNSVIGYLPRYLEEKFNISPLVSNLNHILTWVNLHQTNSLALIALGVIMLLGGWTIFNPAPDAETAIRRCIVPIGIITLLSQNLFSWYMLWLLPLIAIFLKPSNIRFGILALPRLDAWTGWWLFCGLVGLSYSFFIKWKPVNAAIQFEFLPLYAILFIDLANFLWKKFGYPLRSTLTQSRSS